MQNRIMIYRMFFRTIKSIQVNSSEINLLVNLKTWRFVNRGFICQVAKNDCVRLKLKDKNYSFCETYQLSKSYKLPFAKRNLSGQALKTSDFFMMWSILRSVIRRREIFSNI